jgi:hypothetical protein
MEETVQQAGLASAQDTGNSNLTPQVLDPPPSATLTDPTPKTLIDPQSPLKDTALPLPTFAPNDLTAIQTVAETLGFAFEDSDIANDFPRCVTKVKSLNLDILKNGDPRAIIYPIRDLISVSQREVSQNLEWKDEATECLRSLTPVLAFLDPFIKAYPESPKDFVFDSTPIGDVYPVFVREYALISAALLKKTKLTVEELTQSEGTTTTSHRYDNPLNSCL